MIIVMMMVMIAETYLVLVFVAGTLKGSFQWLILSMFPTTFWGGQ